MNFTIANSIEVNGISKYYKITHLHKPCQNVQQGHKQWMNWRRPKETSSIETFWALRDISFTVPKGQILGIIGRNGAGKSTFLKVLSRIIEPSLGFADIYGRVSALLEVGTGFHPDLTGRENIYLNGTLLGMRRKEITEVFDQIIEFADIERFIDTPVKRYSSGMYVRLAFAVAAHLKPDVLIIDEVLSVGDALFQEKCLGRMQRLGESGRTVVFVSHSMEAVVSLCDRAIVLDKGRIWFDGPPQDAATAYYELCADRESSDKLKYRKRGGSDPGVIKEVTSIYHPMRENSPKEAELVVKIFGSLTHQMIDSASHIFLEISISQENGLRVGTYGAREKDEPIKVIDSQFRYSFKVTDPPLNPGLYLIDVSVFTKAGAIDSLHGCSQFRVPLDIRGTYNGQNSLGPVRFDCTGFNLTDDEQDQP